MFVAARCTLPDMVHGLAEGAARIGQAERQDGDIWR